MRRLRSVILIYLLILTEQTQWCKKAVYEMEWRMLYERKEGIVRAYGTVEFI